MRPSTWIDRRCRVRRPGVRFRSRIDNQIRSQRHRHELTIFQLFTECHTYSDALRAMFYA